MQALWTQFIPGQCEYAKSVNRYDMRVFLRVFIALSGLLFIIMGVLAFSDSMSHSNFTLNSTNRFGIAATAWGIIMVIFAIRGRLLKKR